MLQFLRKLFTKQRTGLLPPEKHDPRDYTLGWSFSQIFGSYTPKSESKDNDKGIGSRNQLRLNVCVICSGNSCKEDDENVQLDDEDMAAYLRSKGQLSVVGSSLSSYQKALVDRGVATRKTPIDYSQSWQLFTDKSKLSTDLADVASHKSKSFYKTHDLNKVLEEIDNGKVGQTGMAWYSEYNRTNNLGFLPYQSYAPTMYHAVKIRGYNTNHFGYKVLRVKNSFGKGWGIGGDFYVKFEDFNKFFGQFGVYFSSDMPKDALQVASLYEGKVIKSKTKPNCYLVKGGQKHGIQNSAVLMALGFSFSLIQSIEQYEVDLLAEGKLMTMDDVPYQNIENLKQIIKSSSDKEKLKKIFGDYPMLFT